MRIVSRVLYTAACLAAIATLFYPFYTLTSGVQSRTVMIYGDLWGKIFLIAVAVGMFTLIIGKAGISLTMGIVGLVAVGGEYLFTIANIKSTSTTDQMLRQGAFAGVDQVLDGAANFHATGIQMGESWTIMIAVSAAMFLFGLMAFMSAKPSNY